MRNLQPLENTGILRHTANNKFLGSCFTYRYPETFLTAAHCVRSLKPDELIVELPSAAKGFGVRSIRGHEGADVAALDVVGITEDDVTWPHYDVFDDRAWGQVYMACGYPVEHTADGVVPTARVFQGNIQRFFHHSSHLGYTYFAAELSSGAPAGLSGAALFNPHFLGRLYGVVTENVRTTTELETVLEVTENGATRRERYHNVINYGVAVWLPSVQRWLDSVVPPLLPAEIERRGRNQDIWRQSQDA